MRSVLLPLPEIGWTQKLRMRRATWVVRKKLAPFLVAMPTLQAANSKGHISGNTSCVVDQDVNNDNDVPTDEEEGEEAANVAARLWW